MYVKKTLATLGAAGALSLAGLGGAAPAQAAPPDQVGLVNVTIIDAVDVNNNDVNIQVPVAVAANLCNISILAVQAAGGCEATAGANAQR